MKGAGCSSETKISCALHPDEHATRGDELESHRVDRCTDERDATVEVLRQPMLRANQRGRVSSATERRALRSMRSWKKPKRISSDCGSTSMNERFAVALKSTSRVERGERAIWYLTGVMLAPMPGGQLSTSPVA